MALLKKPRCCERTSGSVARAACGVLLGLSFAAAAAAQAVRPFDFRTIALNGDKGGMLAVVDGQPRLVNSPSALNEWTLQETDQGWTIQSRPSREQQERRFLAVDNEGNVVLTAEPAEGAYWKLDRKGDRTTSFDATLRVSGGRFDGRYIGFSDEQERIAKGRFHYDSYRPVLAERPGPRTALHIFIDGP